MLRLAGRSVHRLIAKGFARQIRARFARPLGASDLFDADDAFVELDEANNVGSTAAPINIARPFIDLGGSFAPHAAAALTELSSDELAAALQGLVRKQVLAVGTDTITLVHVYAVIYKAN